MKTLNKPISMLIALSLLFPVLAFPSSAKSPSPIVSVQMISDDTGNYVMKITEDTISLASQLIDKDGNIVVSLLVDKESKTMYNTLNGQSIQFSPQKELKPCSVTPFDFDFCDEGDAYTSEVYSITVGEIIKMFGVTVSVATLVTFIQTTIKGVVGAFLKKGSSTVGANAIVGILSNAADNVVIYFDCRYICVEMWESDPFDPNGGFYFHGYSVDTNFLDVRWET